MAGLGGCGADGSWRDLAARRRGPRLIRSDACAAGLLTPDRRPSLAGAVHTPVHSLIDQSLHSRLGAETTNGDGFGVGWYDAAPAPGIFRRIQPAWNYPN